MTAQSPADGWSLPRASVADTLAAVAEVILPTVSKGVIVRRPRVVGMAETLGLDRRGVRRMQALRDRYGDGPLMLRIPGKAIALLLHPRHVRRVLAETPEPFSPASAEKVAALAHLEPKASLISEGADRAVRRRFNEEALDTPRAVHPLADAFLAVIAEEMETLLRGALLQGGRLSWDDFIAAWYRMVRRVVLGGAARDDNDLTDMLARLRSAGNWAFLHPGNPDLLARFHDRVDRYLRDAAPGSLAARIAGLDVKGDTAPSHQVAHWLFAFDPGGMATFRALALLAAFPEAAERGREEAVAAGEAAALGGDGTGRAELPFLRAAILESLRLWPTTPAILRETRGVTRWENGTLPTGTTVAIFANFFHRDDRVLPFADRFHPDLWMPGAARNDWPFVPFSDGPGICPAHHLVPMLGGAVLAAILRTARPYLQDPTRLDPGRPLPGTLDNYSLAFRLVS